MAASCGPADRAGAGMSAKPPVNGPDPPLPGPLRPVNGPTSYTSCTPHGPGPWGALAARERALLTGPRQRTPASRAPRAASCRGPLREPQMHAPAVGGRTRLFRNTPTAPSSKPRAVRQRDSSRKLGGRDQVLSLNVLFAAPCDDVSRAVTVRVIFLID
jgi:hypothetical protein